MKIIKTIFTAAVLMAAVCLPAQNKSAGINLSFWKDICTQPYDSTQTTYVNLGLLSTLNRLNGVGINALGSVILYGDMNGVQITGLANLAGGTMRGVQIAGVSNISGNNTVGLSAAGLVNITGDGSKGVIISGLTGIGGDNNSGVMISGLMNVTGNMASGFQFSGVSNITGQSFNGMMTSGLLNVVGEKHERSADCRYRQYHRKRPEWRTDRVMQLCDEGSWLSDRSGQLLQGRYERITTRPREREPRYKNTNDGIWR